MRVSLRNGKSVEIRLVNQPDKDALYNYLQLLSPESRSRFGPHSFDWRTIHAIFDRPDTTIQRYVAIDEANNDIIAYMLIKQGMIKEDQQRYAERNQFFDEADTVTFAPSVADAWQSSGLGSVMAAFIEDELRKKNIQRIILWGGVQATNLKAVNFYKKLNYQFISSFWFDNKDNHDMIKELPA
jgi:diamine N-acetyltransferase